MAQSEDVAAHSFEKEVAIMNQDRYEKVMQIVDRVMDCPPDELDAHLQAECGQDEDLKREVLNLVAAENEESRFLEESPLVALAAHSDDEIESRLIGTRLGPYRIVEEIGRGGMGAVYKATRDDEQYQTVVAIKLIKRGMDTDHILRRFRTERQILASLNHPNIARLLDGGVTEAGLPYFVMEYVDGESIKEFCERQGLSISDRLKLFRIACKAVQYAHQNLIIHRDLKPSNILVTADGTPKLLDFGIAKLLHVDSNGHKSTQLTAAELRALTPEYASPEQIAGDRVTTASDVYSLGVLLYELLTGTRPYRFRSHRPEEVARVICQQEPERPSKAVSSHGAAVSESEPPASAGGSTWRANSSAYAGGSDLRGDLDAIVLMALRKEPQRRYASVEQFSEDVRRYLEGLPVTASKDTWSYRASKFVRRNRIGVAAAVMILVTLLAGMGTTLYQRNVARREKLKAEQRFNDVRHLANSFMFEINEQIKTSPIKARELLVQRAIEYLDKLAAEAGNDIALQSELATAYEKIGEVQGELFNPNLGKTSDALVSHRKALALREKLLSGAPTAALALEVANSHLRIGDILMMSGQIAETWEHYRRAIQTLEPILASDKRNFAVNHKLATAFARLGQAILRSGSLGDALSNYEKSLAIFQNLLAENPNDLSLERQVGITLSYIGFVRFERDEIDEAVNCYGKWLEVEEKINRLNPNDIGSQRHLSTAHTWFGIMLNEQGKTGEAIFHLTEGAKIQEKVFAADKENFGARISLADAQLELAKVLAKSDRAPEAIRLLENAIQHYNVIWQTDSESRWTKRRIAFSQRYLAGAFLQQGDLKKALDIYQQSLATFKELTTADPNYAEWQWDLAMSHLRLGEFYLKTKDKTAALTHFEQALPIFEKLSADSPENIKRKDDLNTVKTHLAGLKS